MPTKYYGVTGNAFAYINGEFVTIGEITEVNIDFEYGTPRRRVELIGYEAATGIKNLISKVIFHDPATIVFWKDGTKTVVKCHGKDKYDKLTGLALAIAKKSLGNTGRYYNVLKPYITE